MPLLISVSEYLNTTYRPDCDYVDGEVRERNLGEKTHSILQGIFFSIFQASRRSWGLLPLLEQRVQTSPTRFRIPDLCLVRPSDGSEPIVRRPPFLCIEILSSEDRLPRMQDRVDDYVAMGVQHIWLVDPIRREAYYGSKQGFDHVVSVLAIPGTPISIPLAEVFAELDDLLAGRL